MTTSNAMHERQSHDRMAALEKEVIELRERLKNTQNALTEVIQAKLAEMDQYRSKKVEAERKACEDILNEMAKKAGKEAEMADNGSDKALAEERESICTIAAIAIRGRKNAD